MADVYVGFGGAPSGIGANPMSRVADGAITANTFVKLSTTTAGRRKQWLTTDGIELVAGVALSSAAIAGDVIPVAEIRGQTIQIRCDGSGTISKGAPVFYSDSSDGRISGTDNGLVAGIAEADDAGGTPDALVSIRW